MNANTYTVTVNGNIFAPINPYGLSVSPEYIVDRAFNPATRADTLEYIAVAYGVPAARARQIAFAMRNKLHRARAAN
jgi:hypothetical protein